MFKMLGPLVVLCYGALLVLRGEMTLGTMLAMNMMAVGFLMPLGNIVSTVTQLQALRQHTEHLDDIFRSPAERPVDNPGRVVKLAGGIEIAKMDFQYASVGAPLLKNIDLAIPPGKMFAIVGRSGSGKSTLIKLLAGLYAPSQGRIVFDGIDAGQLDLQALRQQLGFVPQRPYFLSESIRANIKYFAPVTFEQIQEAAKRACIHEDILAMPMGYETIMSGDGETFSGGQRQRIALARALVRSPKIIILDEATNALDTAREEEVQRNLDALTCTRVIVAHRLSTVVKADQIVVLDGGRIVEQGTHAELMGVFGLYHQLFRSQQAKAEV
jgi:ABC-type bacteriocin/lantibiotic exporter with double-glycine peptidase domain